MVEERPPGGQDRNSEKRVVPAAALLPGPPLLAGAAGARHSTRRRRSRAEMWDETSTCGGDPGRHFTRHRSRVGAPSLGARAVAKMTCDLHRQAPCKGLLLFNLIPNPFGHVYKEGVGDEWGGLSTQ